MKRANQPGVGASLAGCVDFDYFTAAGRGIGLCPSANRASELKQNVMLAWLPVPQPRNCHAGSIPSQSQFAITPDGIYGVRAARTRNPAKSRKEAQTSKVSQLCAAGQRVHKQA